jgi:hypothetical protein
VHRAFAPIPKDTDCRIRISPFTTIPSCHFAALLSPTQFRSQIRAETKALPHVLNIFALEVELINEFVAVLPASALPILERFAVSPTYHQLPHLLELRSHRSHRILEGLVRLSALGKIFLSNYVTTALSVEK